jgi:nucleotide-binding universal stress UspA family protein
MERLFALTSVCIDVAVMLAVCVCRGIGPPALRQINFVGRACAQSAVVDIRQVLRRPMTHSIRSIVHPTDFSHLSSAAFAHALRIAIAAHSKLQALHVDQSQEDGNAGFPHMKRMLVQWGLLQEDDSPVAVFSKLALVWQNVTLDQQDPAPGIVRFLDENFCDLVVLATHGREGLDRWLAGSVAGAVFRQSSIPTLFVPRGARGFVDQVSGEIRLRRVLIPVDHAPVPARAIETARGFAMLLTGTEAAMQLVHVGRIAPAVRSAARAAHITIRYGNTVQTVLAAATEYDADLICMPTAGRHGVIDALRGSTTERVIRQAPCPVLAVPAL